MSDKITALEISKNLPMRVIALKGLAKGQVLRFTKCREEEGKDWQLYGETLDGRIKHLELQFHTEFELLNSSRKIRDVCIDSLLAEFKGERLNGDKDE